MTVELHILASRMQAQRTQLNMVADNVANVETPGYKEMSLSFDGYLSRQQAQDVGTFVKDRGVHFDFVESPVKTTGNPSDATIQGDGFFAVDVNGTTQYTRAGNFQLDSNGILVTHDNHPVLDNAGGPIAIPENTQNFTITKEGSLAADGVLIADLGIYTVPQNQINMMQRAGNNRFIPLNDVTVTPSEAPRVAQGVLEISNVSGVEEMSRMVELSRTYTTAARTMNNMEDLQQRAIRQLAQQPN